ncbi:hypothetical protein ACQP2F_12375 [Actinoplanes sp. CA-030573]|uniref:hypothetical protein n=1 Tax=Actinoplanes sp. CA-030573 TaxID=3239898 RepID=UPI003D8C247C
MPGSEPAPGWAGRLEKLATLLPPVTVITATLLWYGYVATRARFLYFGVYLDLTDLSNRQLLMYGAETTYPVAALLLLATLAVLGAHLTARRILASPRPRRLLPPVAAAAAVGVLLVARALIGMLQPAVAATETPGVTPLSLTAGAPLIVYAAWLARRVALRDAAPESWFAAGVLVRVERVLVVTAFGVLLIGLLWAATSFAWGYGTGRAEDESHTLARRPEIVLFTADPLPAVPPGVIHTDLGPAAKPRHAYRGLRLLLQSGGRLFLVPAEWTDSASTLVIPYDASIRLQLLRPSAGGR